MRLQRPGLCYERSLVDDSDRKQRQPRADIACRRTQGAGYDVGVDAEAEVGRLSLGIYLDEADDQTKAVGLYVNAPRIGSLLVSLSLDKDGHAEVASVTRTDGAARVVSSPTAAALARLEAELATERERAAERLENLQLELDAERAQSTERAAKLDRLARQLATETTKV